ncbi:synemin isoform X2 [Ictalurus furcatus]|uniref:synemin isoform X2 n=1 Tax=Ictalurus furcatus TaxID=66913 RepID=UPI002350D09A|nr:synemin isoform X2 [Ictalurus furcatus]
MFQFKRSFEGEKLQLQELNQRLGQYLSRAKLLEQENARLVAEINTIRHNRSAEWENTRMAELREMRRLVEQLSLEKSRAEMEREKLRRELQLIQAMRSDESAFSRGLDGELKGCEKQLQNALQTNSALEKRMFQLQNECALFHDAHRNEVARLRDQVHTRVLPVVTRTYHGPPAFTTEEVQNYALSLSESWMETFEVYRQQVEEMEESIKADQARLEDIRREKVEYASELNKLRVEMEKHSQMQLELEQHLMDMQEKFRKDVSQYQIIVEELEQERMFLANTISEKLKDHHELLQVKMGLGMEVAAYRALLEGEGKHAQMRSDQYSRERIIDIKMPAKPYTQRGSTMTASRPEVRRNLIGYGFWNTEPISSMRTSTVSSQVDSHKTSRILPITISNHAQKSPAARRDMPAFTKAKQASSTPSATRPDVSASKTSKEVMEEQRVIINSVSKSLPRSSPDLFQTEIQNKSFPTASSTVELKSVRVVAPPMMSLNTNAETPQKVVKKGERNDERTEDHVKATVQPDATPFIQQKESNHEEERDLKDSGNVGPKVFAGEENVLDSVSMEEIIEKFIKPAGLDTKISSSPDSKITYHVEKTEQEDGSTKTQIVLQTKVEEDLDVSDNPALEELLSKGVHKVSLEDLEGSPTGSMIQNLLRLGLESESLENKSVKVEIMEAPLECHSDEGEAEIEETVEVKYKPYFQPSSTFFHIEEPENEPQPAEQHGNTDESMKASENVKSGFVQVQEVSRDESLPYYSQGQETQEYFVSTPEDNMSGSEEGGGFMSYGHYGVVEDLSDERYYQEEGLPTNRRYSDEGENNRESSEYVKRDTTGIPECIIEEEVHVSPRMQESMLEILKEESLDPREQLKGALEQLEGTVSGALKEELVSFTQAGQSSENLSVSIQKVPQSPDNGTTTFVAELNISQSLEDSGLLQNEADDLSQERVMAALRPSISDLHQAHSAGAGGEYAIRLSTEEIQKGEMPWMTNLKETEGLCSGSEISKTEKVIRLGPNERSFTFQMDINNSASATGIEGMDSQDQTGNGATVQEFQQKKETDPSLKVYQEKRIATVYLERPQED